MLKTLVEISSSRLVTLVSRSVLNRLVASLTVGGVLCSFGPVASAQDSTILQDLREEVSEALCRQRSPEPTFDFRPQGWPSFIFNVSADGRTLRYHRSTTIRQIASSPHPANSCIDVDSRGSGRFAEIYVPGMVDAYQAVIDGEAYITMPRKHLDRSKDHWGLPPGTNFYRWADIENNFDRTRSASEVQVVRDADYRRGSTPTISRTFNDPKFRNHYHTIGTFKNSRGQEIVRVMNDLNGASIRDYELSRGSDGSVQWTPLPIVELTSGREDTQNGRTYFDLPMISKDGRYFTVYDRRTMTTKMFAIENGKKREVLDFGIETGKVAFDYTGRRVAFHVDFIDSAQGDKTTGVRDMITKDVLVMNLKSEGRQGQEKFEITDYARLSVSDEKGEGSYYPGFDENGNVYFIHGKGGYRRDAVYHFVKADPDRYSFQPWLLPQNEMLPCPDCWSAQQKLKLNAAAALGNLRARLCSSFADDLSGRDTALATAVLDREQCRQLITYWDTELRDKVLRSKNIRKEKTPRPPGEIEWVPKYPVRGEKQYLPITDAAGLEDLTRADLEAVCPR